MPLRVCMRGKMRVREQGAIKRKEDKDENQGGKCNWGWRGGKYCEK